MATIFPFTMLTSVPSNSKPNAENCNHIVPAARPVIYGCTPVQVFILLAWAKLPT